jgi:hypothetical protein
MMSKLMERRPYLCDGCGKRWDERPEGFEVYYRGIGGTLGLCAEDEANPAKAKRTRSFIADLYRTEAMI